MQWSHKTERVENTCNTTRPPVCEHYGDLQWYLYIEGHKRHKAVVLDDLCQLFIQKAELFEEGVSSQVIEKISQVHDLCVEV